LAVALIFIDIDDVIYDLSNGEILKSVNSLSPGAFNKLKRQLLLELSPPRLGHDNNNKLNERWRKQLIRSPLV